MEAGKRLVIRDIGKALRVLRLIFLRTGDQEKPRRIYERNLHVKNSRKLAGFASFAAYCFLSEAFLCVPL